MIHHSRQTAPALLIYRLRVVGVSLLTRLDSAVGNSGSMTTSHVASSRVVLSEPGVDLSSTRLVSPIAHELADDGEQTDNLNTGVAHAVVGHVTDELGGGARGFHVGPDGEAGVAKGQREEGGADVGGDAGEDDLGLVGGADGVAELFAVPGVDLALALDEGRLGVHLADLSHKRAVRAWNC